MAKYDIYQDKDAHTYLIDVQSDLISGLKSRVVVPLFPIAQAPRVGKKLNPAFEIDGKTFVMMTQMLASVQEWELPAASGNLISHQDEVSAALDMLFIGF